MAETRLQRAARRRAAEIRRTVGGSLRDLREDAGLSLTAVAAAAGIDRSFLGKVEAGERTCSVATLAAVAAVLGADLSVRVFPTTGPRIRDGVQAPMVETLVRVAHARWTASPEVLVFRPARGVIDLVLADDREPLVIASEAHSQLRRLEQQLRWHREKEASLPSADLWRFAAPNGARTSRLLVLRSTWAMRELAATFEATLRAAYPARTADAAEALVGGTRPWPGPAIVWMRVEGSRAELLDGPPRGIRVGR